MNIEVLTDCDGLMLLPEELEPMRAARFEGGYALWRIAAAMKYPPSGLGHLFGMLDGRDLSIVRPDTAIALVRFINASRRRASAREVLKHQVEIEQLHGGQLLSDSEKFTSPSGVVCPACACQKNEGIAESEFIDNELALQQDREVKISQLLNGNAGIEEVELIALAGVWRGGDLESISVRRISALFNYRLSSIRQMQKSGTLPNSKFDWTPAEALQAVRYLAGRSKDAMEKALDVGIWIGADDDREQEV